MAHTEKQRVWLENVSGTIVAASVEAQEIQEQRSQGQALIESKLGSEKDMIGSAFAGVNMRMKSTGLEGVVRRLVNRPAEMKMLDPKHDLDSEFDIQHDGPSSAGMDETDLRILTDNYKKIIQLSQELKKNPYYKEPEKPVAPVEPSTVEQRQTYKKEMETYATELEDARRRLAEDLYKPLEREGVLPEGFIPDEYSETLRQFQAANALYEERLKEYSKSLGENGAFLEKFGDAMAIGKGLLKTALAGTGLAESIGSMAGNSDVVKNAKEAKEIIEWVEVGLSSFDGVVNGALKERDGIAVADSLNAMLGRVLSAVLPGAAANLVNGAVEAAIRSAATGKKLAAGDIEGALRELGKSIASGLGGVDSSDDKSLTEIGNAIQSGLNGLSRLPEVARKIEGGDYRGALSVVIQNLGSVVEDAKGPALKWAQAIDKKVNELGDIVDLAQAQTDIINGQIDKEKLKEQAEKAAKMQAENFQAFMEEQDAGFEEALAYGFGDPTDDIEGQMQAEAKRLESLERIVAVHRRNEMMFELSKKILVGGPEFVAKLVPGMSLVAAATQLGYSIGEAIKSAEQLLIWHANMADAKKASTAQLDAIFNRYGLQKKQTIQANINVAIQAVKVAGEATKLAGQAAPIGFVIAAVADTSKAAMEVSAKIVEVKEMRNAWKVYKKALANPKDRKLAREAMRTNPTLSKYAMAWGAIEDGNPIAKECMRRCGLNERTLAQRESQVGKVVEFLEMKYKDDPVLLRSVVDEETWHPGEIDFTFRSFLKFYQAAVKDAALKPFDFSGVTGAMSALEDAAIAFSEAQEAALKENVQIARENEAALSKARKERQDARRTYDEAKNAGLEPEDLPEYTEPTPKPYADVAPALMTAAVDAAGQAMIVLGGLKPQTAEGTVHASFARYADAMSARARLLRDDFDTAWDNQEWLPG